mmetsp:Transcript_7515/g.27445  ORF Transcript_7515/g.27445 Transcript_7515/m.27445 type:complete len:211 (+) Transcript_7515:174-806(+)
MSSTDGPRRRSRERLLKLNLERDIVHARGLEPLLDRDVHREPPFHQLHLPGRVALHLDLRLDVLRQLHRRRRRRARVSERLGLEIVLPFHRDEEPIDVRLDLQRGDVLRGAVVHLRREPANRIRLQRELQDLRRRRRLGFTLGRVPARDERRVDANLVPSRAQSVLRRRLDARAELSLREELEVIEEDRQAVLGRLRVELDLARRRLRDA